MIWYSIIFAFILLVVDYRITNGNMNVPWNGFGSVNSVVEGTSMAPMQYRVFTPFIVNVFGRSVYAYLAVKYVSLVFMLAAFGFWVGVLGVSPKLGILGLSASLPLTFLFDYHDSYWEIGFIALAFGFIHIGAPVLIICVIAFFAGLNRESAIVIPIAYAFVSLPWAVVILASTLFAIALPRIFYGVKDRYCSAIMIMENLRSLRTRWNNLLGGDVHALMIVGLFIWASLKAGPELLPYIVSLAIFAVMVGIPGLWREARIFGPLSLVIIPMAIK